MEQELQNRLDAQSGRLAALESLTSKALILAFQAIKPNVDYETLGAQVLDCVAKDIEKQDHLSIIAKNHAFACAEEVVKSAVIGTKPTPPIQILPRD